MEPPISPLMQNQEKKVGVMDPNFAQKWLFFLKIPKNPLRWEPFFPTDLTSQIFLFLAWSLLSVPWCKIKKKKWGSWTHFFYKNGLIFLDFGQDPKIWENLAVLGQNWGLWPPLFFWILHQGTNRRLHAKNKKNCEVSLSPTTSADIGILTP